MRVLRIIFPAAVIGILLAWLIIPALWQAPATDKRPRDARALPPLENAEIVQVIGATGTPEGRPVSITGMITADPEYSVDGTPDQCRAAETGRRFASHRARQATAGRR